MRARLRRLAGIVGRALIVVVVTAAAAGAAVWLAGPSGLVSCVPPATGAKGEAVPRWALVAGAPALVSLLVGAYFALGAERPLSRLVGLVLAAALAAGAFYGVYLYLPAACRP